jgi:hypothetical protein
MKEIILSKLFLDKLFKFFFYRNKRIVIAVSYIIVMYLCTLVYIIAFFAKLNLVINWFNQGQISFGIFSILIFILLVIICVYLAVQFNKLVKQTKVGFLDEMSKTYPINSTETININDEGITSKNSTQNHMYFFQYTDIACYYKVNNVYIFQSLDDSFIFVDTDMYNKDFLKDVVKSRKLKKRRILKTFKKES